MIQLQENLIEMFPLERMLAQREIDPSKIINQREPILLLSQIKEVPRHWVEQLEIAGIYDTDDLQSCGEEIWIHLGIDDDEKTRILSQVQSSVCDHASYPQFMERFPDNYAILGTEDRKLVVLWSGLLLIIEGRESYWYDIKDRFDQLLDAMGHPTLIGRTEKHLPHWLQGLVQLETLLRNIPTAHSDIDLAAHWGLSLKGDPVVDGVVAQSYLIELAEIAQQEKG